MRRDPDVSPPSHVGHHIGRRIHAIGARLFQPDALFALKAAVVVGAFSAFAFAPSTVYLFQSERIVWSLIVRCSNVAALTLQMILLTLSRFVGDSTFSFVLRVRGTFVGAILGLLLWSIGAGSGRGSPYGIAAVCAVAFPPMLFWRAYFDVPLTSILTLVTSMLVLGYSWSNAHIDSPVNVGWGWAVAWRRFVTVVIGVTIAFIAGYAPPSYTNKKALRLTHARTLRETGRLLCDVVSWAHAVAKPGPVPTVLIENVSSLRNALRGTGPRRNFIRACAFSMLSSVRRLRAFAARDVAG